MTTSRQGIAAAAAELPHPRSCDGPNHRPSGRPIPTAARSTVDLDRVLELRERRELSATELRLLLGLLDRESGLSELAAALGQRPVEVRRAGWGLARRGLVRWRHAGRLKQTRLEITADGLATLQPLLTAAAGQATASPRTRGVAIR